jgi:hypothetical protein
LSGSSVSFGAFEFAKGVVAFSLAESLGGSVNFGKAEFSGGDIHFNMAEFWGGEVYFSDAEFSGGTSISPTRSSRVAPSISRMSQTGLIRRRLAGRAHHPPKSNCQQPQAGNLSSTR